jgi:outer membrane murein-binding lipoprotein Lpp
MSEVIQTPTRKGEGVDLSAPDQNRERPSDRLTFRQFAGRIVVCAGAFGLVGVGLIEYATSRVGERTDKVTSEVTRLRIKAEELQTDVKSAKTEVTDAMDEAKKKVDSAEAQASELSQQIDTLAREFGIPTVPADPESESAFEVPPVATTTPSVTGG